MASGASGRPNNSGSKGFDFASDDILCSYEDFGAHQDGSNGTLSDPAKELYKSRISKPGMFQSSYSPPPEETPINPDMISAIDQSMKKYSDNLMRFLEGISSRLSQLELYCYNLDKSIGEMRSDLDRDHLESDSKLISVEKHLQEVHRSVQILRDKQELADTQKELAKLHLVQKEKESSSSRNSQQSEDKTPDAHSQSQHLALALPPPPPPRAVEQPPPPQPQPPVGPPQMVQSQGGYYVPNPNPTQVSQSQGQVYGSYQAASQMGPGPQQMTPSYPHQQQWAPQVQVQPQMKPSPSQPPIYASYIPNQPNTPPSEAVQFSGGPPPENTMVTYGYGGPGRPVQPPTQPQPLKPTQQTEGYTVSGSQPTMYVVYDESGRPHHLHQPPHFSQGPPQAQNPQNPHPQPGPNMINHPPQFVRNNNPYNELIEKVVSMGYRGDHVISVIQRLEETGQTVDFNALLDRLNGHGVPPPQRAWSG